MADEFDDDENGGIRGSSGRVGRAIAGLNERVDRLERATDRTDDRVIRLERKVDTLTAQLKQLTDQVNKPRRPGGSRPPDDQ